MKTVNEKLKEILTEKKIEITKVIRFVHILQNKRGEILFVNKISQAGSLSGYDCYLGWQICSECSWGSDLFNNNIIEMEKNVVEQKTGLLFQMEDIEIVDVFCSEMNKENYLNVVVLFNIKDETSFSYWHEWDTEIAWLSDEKVELKIKFKEDKQILFKLRDNVYKNSLL